MDQNKLLYRSYFSQLMLNATLGTMRSKRRRIQTMPRRPAGQSRPMQWRTTDSRELEAYSDPLGWYSKITFCKLFLDRMPDLDFVINTAKRNSQSYQNHLWNYQDRARLLFHEMTHLNYVVNAPDISPYVDDVKIRWKDGRRIITSQPMVQSALRCLLITKLSRKVASTLSVVVRPSCMSNEVL